MLSSERRQMNVIRHMFAYPKIPSRERSDGIKWPESLPLGLSVHHLHHSIQGLWRIQQL